MFTGGGAGGGGVDVELAAFASKARRAGGSALAPPFVGGVPVGGELLAPVTLPACPNGELTLAPRRGSTDAAVCAWFTLAVTK